MSVLISSTLLYLHLITIPEERLDEDTLKGKEMKIEVGDVVLIKGGEKYKGKCSNIGTVEELLKCKNDAIRASIRY